MMYPISKTKSIIKDLGYKTARFSKSFNKFIMKMPDFKAIGRNDDLKVGCLPNGKEGLFILLKNNSSTVRWGILLGSFITRVPAPQGFGRPILLAPAMWVVALYDDSVIGRKAHFESQQITCCSPSPKNYLCGVLIQDYKGETIEDHKTELNYVTAQALSVAKRLEMRLPDYDFWNQIYDQIHRMI